MVLYSVPCQASRPCSMPRARTRTFVCHWHLVAASPALYWSLLLTCLVRVGHPVGRCRRLVPRRSGESNQTAVNPRLFPLRTCSLPCSCSEVDDPCIKEWRTPARFSPVATLQGAVIYGTVSLACHGVFSMLEPITSQRRLCAMHKDISRRQSFEVVVARRMVPLLQMNSLEQNTS